MIMMRGAGWSERGGREGEGGVSGELESDREERPEPTKTTRTVAHAIPGERPSDADSG